jgi:hypothetical protein
MRQRSPNIIALIRSMRQRSPNIITLIRSMRQRSPNIITLIRSMRQRSPNIITLIRSMRQRSQAVLHIDRVFKIEEGGHTRYLFVILVGEPFCILTTILLLLDNPSAFFSQK